MSHLPFSAGRRMLLLLPSCLLSCLSGQTVDLAGRRAVEGALVQTAPDPGRQALRIEDARLTREQATTCAVPEATDQFYSTDAAIYLWFKAYEAKAGDVPREEWYGPDGRLFRSSQWAPMEKDASFCLWARLQVAGTDAATKLGPWQVKLFWNQSLLFTLDFTISAPPPAPRISTGGVVNAADYTAGFAPGCLVSIFGENLAGATARAAAVPLPKRLGDTTVEIVDGERIKSAPLFFVSRNQVNGQLPFQLASANARVRIRHPGGVSNEIAIPVESRNPRLFTQTMDGRGDALVVHADYTPVRASAPAQPSEVLILYLTGLGEVTPAITEGNAAGDGMPGRPLNEVTERVEVLVGGRPAEVLWVGLAPGFAGLYQVNFRVPATAAGVSEIGVRCGQRSSQQAVRLSVAGGSTIPPTVPVSIGPAGGQVAAEGLELVVPAGSFPRPMEVRITAQSQQRYSNQVTPVYTISGLPDRTTAPLTLTVRPTTAVARDERLVAFVDVSVAGFDPSNRLRGPAKFDAQLAGDLIRLTIPPWDAQLESTPSGQNASGGRRAASSPPQVTFELTYTGRWRHADMTGNRLFEMWSDQSATQMFPNDWLRQIQQGFEQGKTFLETKVNLPWPKREWPLRVYVYELGSEADGGECSTFWGESSQCINLNAANITSSQPSTLTEAKTTAIHELFHTLQNLLHPSWGWSYQLGAGSIWDWMFEASSAWLENQMPGFSAFPSSVQKDLDFLKHGLEYHPFGMQDVQIHGYGASLFLQYLSRNRGAPFVGGIIRRVENLSWFTSSAKLYVPTVAIMEALTAAGTTLEDEWPKFVRALMDGNLAEGVHFPDEISLDGAKAGTVNLGLRQAQPFDSTRLEGDSVALSGKIYRLAQVRNVASNLVLEVTLNAGGPIRAFVYGMTGGGAPTTTQFLCECTSTKKSCAVSNPENWTTDRKYLALVVVNSDVNRPFDGVRPFTVEFRYQPDPLAALKKMITVTAYVTSTLQCSGPTATNNLCGDTTLSVSNYDYFSINPAIPIIWNGSSFQADGTRTTSSSSRRLEISASIDNSDSVWKATGRFVLTTTTQIYDGVSTTVRGITFKDLPLTSQLPSSVKFEVTHPADWRKYVSSIEYRDVVTTKGVAVVQKQFTGLGWKAGDMVDLYFMSR